MGTIDDLSADVDHAIKLNTDLEYFSCADAPAASEERRA